MTYSEIKKAHEEDTVGSQGRTMYAEHPLVRESALLSLVERMRPYVEYAVRHMRELQGSERGLPHAAKMFADKADKLLEELK